MNRTTRKFFSFFTVIALLFSQWVIPAHACPMQLQNAANMVMDVSASDDGSSDQSTLCQQHCQNEQKNFADLPSPLASVALVPSFIVTLDIEKSSITPSQFVFPTLQHATSPPLAIRNCCFRI